MGWEPKPRWRAGRQRWVCTIQGKKFTLGRSESAAWARLRQIQTRLGCSVDPGRPATVPVLIDAWQRRHAASAWQRAVLAYWSEAAAAVGLADIKTNHLADLVGWMRKKKYAAKTIGHAVAGALRVCRWARDEDLIEKLPAAPLMDAPDVAPRDISNQALSKLQRSIQKSRRKRAGRLLRFIAATGCRPIEARLLRWSDLRKSKSGWWFEVAEHKTRRKTGEPKIIPLPPAAKSLVQTTPRTGQWVFPSRLGTPYTGGGLRRIMKRACGATPYQLRHKLAQSMFDAGMSRTDVAGQLGHRDERTTDIYIRTRGRRAVATARRIKSPMAG